MQDHLRIVILAHLLNPCAVTGFARFRDRVFNQLDGVIHDEDEDDPVQ